MALINCPECNQQISDMIKACPHCGFQIKKPWYEKILLLILVSLVLWPVGVYGIIKSKTIKKKYQKIIIGIFLLLFNLAFYGAILPTSDTETVSENIAAEPEAPATEPIEQEVEEEVAFIEETKNFGVNAEIYIENFNKALNTIESGMVIKMDNTEEGDYNISYQMSITELVGVVATANKQTKKIESCIFIGLGDGTIDSGANILLSCLAFVMALEDPNMPVEERSIVGNQTGLFDDSLSEEGTITFIRGEIKYTCMLSDELGFWMSAEKI